MMGPSGRPDSLQRKQLQVMRLLQHLQNAHRAQKSLVLGRPRCVCHRCGWAASVAGLLLRSRLFPGGFAKPNLTFMCTPGSAAADMVKLDHAPIMGTHPL